MYKAELYFASVKGQKKQDYWVEVTGNGSEFKYLYRYK